MVLSAPVFDNNYLVYEAYSTTSSTRSHAAAAKSHTHVTTA